MKSIRNPIENILYTACFIKTYRDPVYKCTASRKGFYEMGDIRVMKDKKMERYNNVNMGRWKDGKMER